MFDKAEDRARQLRSLKKADLLSRSRSKMKAKFEEIVVARNFKVSLSLLDDYKRKDAIKVTFYDANSYFAFAETTYSEDS